jgi:hypothetical protein
MSPGKHPEGKLKPEKGKTVAEQSKKACTTTIQTTPAEQASESPSDVFTASLVVIPADDWCRTSAEDRTNAPEDDLKESQRGSGQASPACCCEGEHGLHGRHHEILTDPDPKNSTRLGTPRHVWDFVLGSCQKAEKWGLMV